MIIYIQKIQTNWMKRSRGFPHSTLRNSVPEILPIEPIDSTDTIVFQETIFEEGCFESPIIKKSIVLNEHQLREQQLEINKTTDNTLEISFWNPLKIKKKVGTLNYNSWCQIKSNWRFPMEYTWGYKKVVYNIFYGDPNNVYAIQKATIEKDYQSLLR
ncbi:hypothetical protein [Flammeovirga sp. EKP202]|uniref:hypothetical protein n=1 Tax=Flammeovirga sp. EKP202 TaxID=2770592 RepID=UPI00165FAFFD|nr:hypothetical protein [Flammeovirga sp. EKP202]MBD0401222.1 hypothetical protein [Flammeovirga sp. EKP202]